MHDDGRGDLPDPELPDQRFPFAFELKRFPYQSFAALTQDQCKILIRAERAASFLEDVDD